METPLKGLYDRLPAMLQNLAVTGFSAVLDRQRYGGEFKDFRRFLNESQWFSEQDLQDYQTKQLRRLIN